MVPFFMHICKAELLLSINRSKQKTIKTIEKKTRQQRIFTTWYKPHKTLQK